MSDYRPPEPQGGSPQVNWAQKTHRQAYQRNKVIGGPGIITSNTTQGVIQRVKQTSGGGSGGSVPKWG